MSFHVGPQMEGTPFRDGDQVIVKLHSFLTVTLEPGWSLLATRPVNRADLPFRLLTGLVDADRFERRKTKHKTTYGRRHASRHEPRSFPDNRP